MKNVNVSNYKYDWAIFAYSYFNIASLACQELLVKRESKHTKSKFEDIKIPYRPGDLYISIVFNIKHGIEVFIKTLGIFAYGQYDEIHDIQRLFSDATQRIKKLKLKPQKSRTASITQEEIDELPKDLKEIEKLVEYFYTLNFLNAKVGSNYMFYDIRNDIFRYPDNNATVRIDWGAILNSQINIKDIEQLLGKLEEVNKLFSQSTYLFSVLDTLAIKSKEWEIST